MKGRCVRICAIVLVCAALAACGETAERKLLPTAVLHLATTEPAAIRVAAVELATMPQQPEAAIVTPVVPAPTETTEPMPQPTEIPAPSPEPPPQATEAPAPLSEPALQTNLEPLDQYRAWMEEARVLHPYAEPLEAMWQVMLCESSGNPDTISGEYHGLFQYSPSTWSGDWNPYRGQPILDPHAQIFATAKAWHDGKQGWWGCYGS